MRLAVTLNVKRCGIRGEVYMVIILADWWQAMQNKKHNSITLEDSEEV